MTCSICQQESKYKCPACSAQTCSLACSKQHKVAESCTGLPDPTKYLKREALFTDESVNRDYKFLKQLERDLVVRRQDGEALPIFKKARYNQNRKDGKDGNVTERNGVKVYKVAQGMGRQKRNQSKWDPSVKQFCWTVEWVDADGIPGSNRVTVDKINPVHSVLECYQEMKSKENGKDKAADTALVEVIEPSGVCTDTPSLPKSFYLTRIKSRNTSPIILDPSKPLSENLRGKSILEYPTIYYTTEELVASDSDSDSDSGSDSDSDSDSAPEEESAREVTAAAVTEAVTEAVGETAVSDVAVVQEVVSESTGEV